MGDDFSVYSGNDDNLISTLAVGGDGVISVTSNIIPKYIRDICRNWFDKKYDEARDMHLALCELNSLLFSEVNPIPVKAAMNMLGFKAGGLRLPLVEMTSTGKEKLRKEMKKLNII